MFCMKIYKLTFSLDLSKSKQFRSYYLPGKHTIILAFPQQFSEYGCFELKDYTKIKIP